MTQDEIIEMAKLASAIPINKDFNQLALIGTKNIETFAKLIAQRTKNRIFKRAEIAAELAIEHAIELEREACAKVCDLALFQCQETMNELDATEHIAQCIVQGAMNQAVKLSNAIRARGQA